MRVRIPMLALAIAAVGCAGARAPVPVAGAPGVTIPSVVKNALDAQWGGWQIVTPGAEAAPCASRFDRPPVAVATGDWNGDGTDDLAFQIAAPDGRRIVVAFARLDGAYVLREVSAVQDAGGVLGVKRRARSYRQQADGIEFFYSLDTLAFGPCDQPETVYFWNGTAFEGRRVFD